MGSDDACQFQSYQSERRPRLVPRARVALIACSMRRELSVFVPLRRDSSPISLSTSGSSTARRKRVLDDFFRMPRHSESKSPEGHSGLSDTRRRSPNIYYDKTITLFVKRFQFCRVTTEEDKGSNPSGCKPLDIWRTSSSTHWQCPPKRSLTADNCMGRCTHKREQPSNYFGMHSDLGIDAFERERHSQAVPLEKLLSVTLCLRGECS